MSSLDSQTQIPDLSLNKETVDFLARILLEGGATTNYAHTNGSSLKVSEMLASGHGGFFDNARYPDLHARQE